MPQLKKKIPHGIKKIDVSACYNRDPVQPNKKKFFLKKERSCGTQRMYVYSDWGLEVVRREV